MWDAAVSPSQPPQLEKATEFYLWSKGIPIDLQEMETALAPFT